MSTAIYPGSFDPVTLGHMDIIDRTAKIFDRVIISILNNQSKVPLFSVEERIKLLREVTKQYDNVEIQSFDGLLIDYATKTNADVIIRGLRAVTDFEYELQMSQTNHKLNPNVETMFFTTSVEYSYLSSSTVKEVAHFGGCIDEFVTPYVADQIYKKMNQMEEK